MLAIKLATAKELSLLLDLRLEVLRAANKLSFDTPLFSVRENTKHYYKTAFANNTQQTYLAYQEDVLVGCGSVCFYTLLPTCDHETGRCAYIMNMYTRPAFRRQGIATALLDHLVEKAKQAGASKIML
ncbi:MAG: GNAT family N-acetyltransferase [Christensenellaceae bacterium]